MQRSRPISTTHVKRLDAVGASLSLACALHCALQPVLLAVLPLLGLGMLLDENLESLFLGFSILLASATIVSGWRHHRQPHALPLLFLAVGLIVSSRVPAFEALEMPLAVSGALSIMSAHLFNLRLHRKAHGDHADEHQAHIEQLEGQIESLEKAVGQVQSVTGTLVPSLHGPETL